MSHSSKLRRRRHVLFEQQKGFCYWCNQPMRELPPDPKRRPMPKDMCTIDHLRDRFDPARQQRCKHGEQRLVAACWECNNRRGIERQAAISKKTLRRRAGRHPQTGAPVSPA